MTVQKTEPQAGFALSWCEYQPQSLCASLAQAYHHWSDEQIAQALAAGLVQRNGQTVYHDQLLVPGDQLQLWLAGHSEADTDTGWTLLWQRHDLMAVHKPAGLPVSRTTRNLFNTLISLVRRATEYKDAHLLHRLDAETSGLVLLANYSHADKRWKKHLDRLMQQKTYHALVWGNPAWQQLDYGCWLSERKDSPIRTRMYVTDEHDEAAQHAPKWSQTRFHVLQRYGTYSLLTCTLGSGRKHQIRAQLAHLGHPVIGDKIYSYDGAFYLKRLQQDLTTADLAVLGAPHHLLHAYSLQLDTGAQQYALCDETYPPAWQPYLQGTPLTAD